MIDDDLFLDRVDVFKAMLLAVVLILLVGAAVFSAGVVVGKL